LLADIRSFVKDGLRYNALLKKNQLLELKDWVAAEKDEFWGIVQKAKRIELAYNGMKVGADSWPIR
jgi:hypothetical protein